MAEGAQGAPGGLAKAYRPSEFEGPIYERWLAADVFAPDGAGSRADAAKPPFVIIQPPPNVTGSLHLGHAQRSAVEDLMIRHARMQGRPGALPAGSRPRQHRRPVRPRPDHRRRRRDAGEPWPRALPRADVALHRRDARGDPRAAAAPGGLDRLGTPALHDGRRLQPRRPRGVPPSLPRGARLPPRDAHQLVPRLPDEPLRPRGDRHPGDRERSGRSATTWSTTRRAPTSRARSSRWPPRGPRRSSATPASRCTPTTPATRASWAARRESRSSIASSRSSPTPWWTRRSAPAR